MRAALAVLSIGVLCTFARPALADPREESRAQFRRGVELVKQESYRAAKDAFERAYELFPHPSILLNLGTTRLKVGEYVKAERDLTRFLSDDGGAPVEEVESARRALAETRTHLGTLRVQVDPAGSKVTLDGQELALTAGRPTDVRVVLGRHELAASLDGHVPARAVVDVSDPATPGDVRRTLAPSKREAPPDEGPNVAGWSFAGGGVLALGFGVFSGLRARSLADDYNTPGSGHYQDPSTRSDGVAFRTAADVAFLVGVASVAVGAYFLFVAPPRSVASSTRRPEIVPGAI